MGARKERWQMLSPAVPSVSPANKCFPKRDGPGINLLQKNNKNQEKLCALLLNVANINDVWTTLCESEQPELKNLTVIICDSDCYMLARHFVLMYIALNLDITNDADVQFLWAVWLDQYLKAEHAEKLAEVLHYLLKHCSLEKWNLRMANYSPTALNRLGQYNLQCSLVHAMNGPGCCLYFRLKQVFCDWATQSTSIQEFSQQIEENNENFFHCYNLTTSSGAGHSKEADIKTDIHNRALDATSSGVETLMSHNPQVIEKFVNSAYEHFKNGSFFLKESLSHVNPTYLSKGYYWQDVGSDLRYTHFCCNTVFANFAPIQLPHESYQTWSVFTDCIQLLKKQLTELHSSLSSHLGSVTILVENEDPLLFGRTFADDVDCSQTVADEMRFDIINTYMLPDSCGLLNVLLHCLPLVKAECSVFTQSTFSLSPVYYAKKMLVLHNVLCSSTSFGYDIDELYTLPRHVMASAGYQQFRWTRIDETSMPALSLDSGSFRIDTIMELRECL